MGEVSKYYTLNKPKSDDADGWEAWYQDAVVVNHVTVYEQDIDHVATGLLNESGDMLFKRARPPIGFLRDDE